jgi:hypothetical protein
VLITRSVCAPPTQVWSLVHQAGGLVRDVTGNECNLDILAWWVISMCAGIAPQAGGGDNKWAGQSVSQAILHNQLSYRSCIYQPQSSEEQDSQGVTITPSGFAHCSSGVTSKYQTVGISPLPSCVRKLALAGVDISY